MHTSVNRVRPTAFAACAAAGALAAIAQTSARGARLDHASSHGGDSSNPGGKNQAEQVHAGASSDARRAPAKQPDASAYVDGRRMRRMSDATNSYSRAS